MVSLNWLAAIVSSVGLNTPSASLSTPSGPTEVWLAVLDHEEGPCPAGADGWVLLPSAGTPFERFCEYGFYPTPTHSYADPNALEHPALSGLTNAQIGRVKPQQQFAALRSVKAPTWPTAMSTAMAPYLWDHFKAQAGVPAVPAGVSATPNVRLAIVDTMPDGAPQPNSLHATTLGALAEAVGCTSTGQCAMDVEHYLGLPRVEDGVVDLVNGGNYGTLWDLARGVQQATQDSIADGFDRVVINLSLGWDPTGQPGLPSNHLGLLTSNSTLPAPLLAVHTALVYARCQGALIIAASGNDDVGLEDRTGPLLPAGWMTHDAPTTADCGSLFTFNRSQPKISAKVPLVYAVGGANHLGKPLENARPQSTPELVAPASSVVAPTGGAVLTGTSVGALVASTASAMAWAVKNQAGADAILNLVKASASPLSWSASFCTSSTCPAVRQVSLCGAQHAACQGTPGCDATACLSNETLSGWSSNMLLQGGLTLLSKTTPQHMIMGLPQPVVGCGLVRMPSPNPFVAPYPCPLDEDIAARALDVAPQPLDPMCPTCLLSEQVQGPVIVGIELVPDIPGGLVHDVYLEVSNANQEQVYALPGPLPQGASEVFVLNPTGWTAPVTKAWLQYVVIKNGQPYFLGEPLIVD